jgi:4-amino-4-deoxy-L-arabinose transferase-like glycosyltransferase
VGVLVLLVYLATLSPGLTFRHNGTDGGDLVTAAWTLGVPHPTGYPVYTLLAWLFSRIPVGTVAYRVNLLSAVCASATVSLLFCCARRLLPQAKRSTAVSAAAALSLGFSSLLWSQAVISEVYALLTLFGALLLWLLLLWQHHGRDSLLWLSGLVLGLGLGNHLTLGFAIPAALILLWPLRSRWIRARVLLPATLLFLAGLAVYAYLPLAATRQPAVNWGNPQNWRGFHWLVTGKQYQAFAFGLDAEEIVPRLGAWSYLLGDQFGWWGLLVALAGAGWLLRRNRRFALFALAWSLPLGLYAFLYDTGDSYVYLLPAFLLLALCWAAGVHYLFFLLESLRPVQQRLSTVALLTLVVLAPLGSLCLHWRSTDLRGDWSVHAYIHDMLEPLPPDSLVIVRGDRPTFALWYGIYVEDVYAWQQRTDVALVNAPMLAFIWYRDHIRHLYPYLTLREPLADQQVTTDDLTRDLITGNITSRPVFATDPKDAWETWFTFDPEGSAPIYRVQLTTLWEPVQ